MCSDFDSFKSTVVFAFAVMFALGNGTFDTVVCLTVHKKYLQRIILRYSADGSIIPLQDIFYAFFLRIFSLWQVRRGYDVHFCLRQEFSVPL